MFLIASVHRDEDVGIFNGERDFGFPVSSQFDLLGIEKYFERGVVYGRDLLPERLRDGKIIMRIANKDIDLVYFFASLPRRCILRLFRFCGLAHCPPPYRIYRRQLI